MAMKVTLTSDHALRAMIHLACLPEDQVALRTEIAAMLDIPASFMAKILSRLSRARLLRSARGVHGGFRLARPAAEITMLDIVEAIEGPLRLTACAPDPAGCPRSAECPATDVWLAVQTAVRDRLGAATLEGLVSTPRRRRNGCGASPRPNGILAARVPAPEEGA